MPISPVSPAVSAHRHDDHGHGHGHGHGHETSNHARPGRAASPFASPAARRLGKVALALAGLWIAVGWALGWWGW